MCKKVVAWDLDGTVLYNILNINYDFYIKKYDIETLNRFCRLNPIINPSDVQLIVTARSSKTRATTQKQLDKHNINADVIMYPFERWAPERAIDFKANTLNELGADFYIDDDIILLKNLKNKTSAECITTVEFYS